MKYKYQLIILGSDSPHLQPILTKIDEKIAQLGLKKEIINVIYAKETEAEYGGNQPAFALYFGDTAGYFKDIDITEKLIKDGTMILPIYDESFEKEIPKVLKNQNAIQYHDNQIERIVSTIFESFELLRSSRKVFISYKRSESTSIAIQLYEALESHNFDVFLDTHSIAKGDAFQDELWHRMTDCDVIVLLNTPEFLESHWCKEEFAEAAAKKIGIVQIIWPNNKKIEGTSQLSFPLSLKAENFIQQIYDDKEKSKLNSDTLDFIIKEVESIRARNLASRQDNLITEFRSVAEKHGRTVTVQPERYLTEIRPNNQHIIYIPTIGIPQSTNCQSAEIKKELLGFGSENVIVRLIYDDLRIRKKWLEHLDWLNDNFKKDIKTLKKQEFESWLKQK